MGLNKIYFLFSVLQTAQVGPTPPHYSCF